MIGRYKRFIGFFATTILVTLLGWPALGFVPALLIGFDAGVLVFLASLVSLFGSATAASMRQRSQANEPDHLVLMAAAIAIAAATIYGIWYELLAIKPAAPEGRAAVQALLGVGLSPGSAKAVMIALPTASLALVWLFANALGSIHYAHLWYLHGKGGGDARGLEFPKPDGSEAFWPDYWDFAYFAVVLSMTFQVSDVTITAKPVRRLALVHGLVAFLFNISVIALSVSLVTSALGQ